MSHSDFNTIFTEFKKVFPPADPGDSSFIKMTTGEILKIFSDFHPEIDFPSRGLFQYMVENGYSYQPIKEEAGISFYWLFKSIE